MKSTLIPFLSAAILLSGAMVSIASAEGVAVGIQTNVKAQVQVGRDAELETRGSATSSAVREESRDNATSSATRDNRGNATSTDADANGQLTAESHRSTVAAFVQGLLDVADREEGIGAQVRVIAREQNESASTSVEAIAKVESRSGFTALLFGNDFKNLGVLRSELATTTNHIEQLKNLRDKATNDADKAELSAQIKVLEDSQVKIDAFVRAHEDSFSFFGWFIKLFVQ